MKRVGRRGKNEESEGKGRSVKSRRERGEKWEMDGRWKEKVREDEEAKERGVEETVSRVGDG